MVKAIYQIRNKIELEIDLQVAVDEEDDQDRECTSEEDACRESSEALDIILEALDTMLSKAFKNCVEYRGMTDRLISQEVIYYERLGKESK